MLSATTLQKLAHGWFHIGMEELTGATGIMQAVPDNEGESELLAKKLHRWYHSKYAVPAEVGAQQRLHVRVSTCAARCCQVHARCTNR